ncbi:MAG TPA: MASE3 domain-containing protein, partial [Methanospirillum sp.]|nr:MASE3 domain-containing protein [Methanospirillum sp.]
MISFKKPVWSFVLTLSVFIIGISLTIEYSYLLFHIFAEFFSIIIAGVIFVITWNSRDKLDNGYLLFIGISFFFVGSIDLLHAIAYKGMNIFIGYDANLPTQMWIAARYLEAASLLIAPVMLTRRVDTRITLFVFVAVTSSLILLLFTNNFPDCYIEGLGLTSF